MCAHQPSLTKRREGCRAKAGGAGCRELRLGEPVLHLCGAADLGLLDLGLADLGLVMGLRRILAVASFLLYAAAVIIAVHRWPSKWYVENAISVPNAISNIVYGLPLGLTDSNVLAEFNDAFAASGKDPLALDKAVETAARGGLSRGTPVTPIDGIGIGQQLFTDLAMRVFGVHLLSMTYFFLLLMGLSALAFTGRYSDRRLIYVPLQFVALTCMLLTPLMTDPVVRDQAPIGGNRFFVILAILPALHIFFELSDGVGGERNEVLKNWLLLSVQILLFVLAMLVRSAGAYGGADDLRRGVFDALLLEQASGAAAVISKIRRHGNCRSRLRVDPDRVRSQLRKGRSHRRADLAPRLYQLLLASAMAVRQS